MSAEELASGIVFVSTEDGEMDIWTMAPDSTDRRNLTCTFDWEEDHPAWAPDGKIAFCSRRHGKGEIYLMDADGGSLERITHNDVPDLRPHFSWDGQQILFASDQRPLEDSDAGGDNPSFAADGRWITFTSRRDEAEDGIYIIGADGRGARRVTPAGLRAWQSSFSPDGFAAHWGPELQG